MIRSMMGAVAAGGVAVTMAGLAGAAHADSPGTPAPGTMGVSAARDAGGNVQAAPSVRTAPAATTGERTASGRAARMTRGIDVSRHNGNVDWAGWKVKGVRFAYVKATQGTSSTDPMFATNKSKATAQGLYVGAYHYATPRPGKNKGAAEANWFVAHGGRWTPNGAQTLPGALDLDAGGAGCFGMTPQQMRNYIASFTQQYKRLTGKDAVIYSSKNWWIRCTGNTGVFAKKNPLWVAQWGVSKPWAMDRTSRFSFWQYQGSASGGTDLNYWNGSPTRLHVLATQR